MIGAKALRLVLLCFAALASAPAQAGRLGGGSAPDISIIRILAALVLCALVALAVILIIRVRSGRPISLSWQQWPKFGGIAAARLEIIESRRISAHADVCLVRCDGRDYLLACGPGGIIVVDQPDAEFSIDEPEPENASP